MDSVRFIEEAKKRRQTGRSAAGEEQSLVLGHLTVQ